MLVTNPGQAMGMDVFKAISRRFTARSYLDKPVPFALVKKIVAAGVQAPSSLNKQPWHFIVVKDKKTRAAIRGIYDDARKELGYYEQDTSFMELGTLIVLCTESNEDDQKFSCMMAAQNMLLAATALGLGSGPSITILQSRKGEKRLRRLLGIPEKVSPLLVITLGYVDEKPAHRKKKKGLKKAFHKNRW